MKMMKRKGDRTDPCGRPSLKFRLLPRVPLTFTLESRLVSPVPIRRIGGGDTPSFRIFRRRPFLHTVSYAFE